MMFNFFFLIKFELLLQWLEFMKATLLQPPKNPPKNKHLAVGIVCGYAGDGVRVCYRGGWLDLLWGSTVPHLRNGQQQFKQTGRCGGYHCFSDTA